MAAPSFVGAGTGVTDAGGAWGAISAAVAGQLAGDICIFQILQDGNTNGAISSVVGANMEDLAGTDNVWTQILGPNADGSWPVGNPAAARQFLYIGRYRFDGSAATISGANSTSEDLYVRGYAFRNVSTGTTLATVIENSTAGNAVSGDGTSATAADTGVTTLGPDRLALNFVAVNDDNVIPDFTGETGGDWTLAVSPYADSAGTDGAIGLQIAYPGIAEQATAAANNLIYGGSGTYEQDAQSFVTSGAVTTSGVRLYVTKQASPTDNLVVEIQTDNSDTPSGTVLGSAQIAGGSLVNGWQSFSIAASLSASTKYWIVARRDGARDTTNYFNTYWSAATNPYTAGTAKTRNSGTWSTDTDRDLAFQVGVSTGATINGGSASITDSDAWGVVGFALIGTTVVDTTYYPRHPAHDFGSVTNF